MTFIDILSIIIFGNIILWTTAITFSKIIQIVFKHWKQKVFNYDSNIPFLLGLSFDSDHEYSTILIKIIKWTAIVTLSLLLGYYILI